MKYEPTIRERICQRIVQKTKTYREWRTITKREWYYLRKAHFPFKLPKRIQEGFYLLPFLASSDDPWVDFDELDPSPLLALIDQELEKGYDGENVIKELFQKISCSLNYVYGG